MKAYIYCRVSPHNNAVSKPDKLLAQQLRCRQYIKKMGIYKYWRYFDEGEMHPVKFLPSMQELLVKIKQEEGRFIVVADHPGRLGKEISTQKHLITLIERAGGRFVSPPQKSYGGSIS
jgi:DNA invertase Pin-like site-specific DNA recombinase